MAEVDVWGFLTASSTETFLRDAYFEVASGAASKRRGPAPRSQIGALPELLTRVTEIRKLPRDVAAQRIPLRLRGVITCVIEWRTCFSRMRAAAFMSVWASRPLCLGRRSITGVTDPGGYAPQVINPTFQVFESTNMPAPAKVDLDDLADGHLDAQWIELQAWFAVLSAMGATCISSRRRGGGLGRSFSNPQASDCPPSSSTPGSAFKALVLRS